MKNLLESFPDLFYDVPYSTTVLAHDVDKCLPIKQHVYYCLIMLLMIALMLASTILALQSTSLNYTF